jgi:pheromone shutdown protein TraB
VNKYEEKKTPSSPLFLPVAQDAKNVTFQFDDLNNNDENNLTNGELALITNKCGCTENFVKVMIVATVLLFILFFSLVVFVTNGNSGAIMLLFAMLFLITSIVFCSLHCCACCKRPTGLDD